MSGYDVQLADACERDGLGYEEAAAAIDAGELILLRSRASRGRETFRAQLVGSIARKKVVGLIGLGPNERDPDTILTSITPILVAEPHALIELSTNEHGITVRAELKKLIDIPLGACITYDLLTRWRERLTADDVERTFRTSLEAGVDFILVHAGVDWSLIAAMDASQRTMPTTSRGGGLVARYMKTHDVENPIVEHFDLICSLCREYEVVLDLGDVFRPGCLEDAGDDLKLQEIDLLAELRLRARAHGVQVLCESGGHMPLNRIGPLIDEYKRRLGGAPMWLAGPIPLDTGVTLDATVNTLGVVTAAQAGGDLFASITDVEHYAMPTSRETSDAIRRLRVAISAVEYARGDPRVVAQNREMGRARRLNSWTDQAELALYPDLAHQVFTQHSLLKEGKPCTICGQFCPHVIVERENDLRPDLSVV